MRTLCGCLLVVSLPLLLTVDGLAQPQKNGPALPSKADKASDNTLASELRPEDVIRVLAAPAFRHGNGVHCVVASSDGKQLVTGTKDGAFLWDVASGRRLKVLASGDVRNLALARDVVAVGRADGFIGVFEIGTRKKRFSTTHPGAYATWLALTPDGSTLAFARVSEIQLWNVATGKLAASLTGHTESVSQALFHPDGKSLISVSADGTLREWTLAAGKETRRLTVGPDWFAVALSFSADGKSLGVVLNSAKHAIGQVRVLEAGTLKERFRVVVSAKFGQDVSLSKDGRFVAATFHWTVLKDSHIPVWDTWTGKLTRLEPEYNPLATGVACLADGKTLASGGDDGVVRLWSLADGKEQARTKGLIDPITALAFSPKGDVLAAVVQTGAVQLWDIKKGVVTNTLHKGYADNVLFSPDGRLLLATGAGEYLKQFEAFPGIPKKGQTVIASDKVDAALWDASTGKHIRSLPAMTSRPAFSPDSKSIVAGNGERGLSMWDVASGAELMQFTGHALPIRSVAFSQDGRLLASASEDLTVRLWQVSTGLCVAKMPVRIQVTEVQLAFSPDDSLLFVCFGSPGIIDVYETATCEFLFSLTDVPMAKRLPLTVQHRGATLLLATAPGNFRAIDLASSITLASHVTHGGDFGAMAWSADGRMLALSYPDGALALCKPPTLPPRMPIPATMAADAFQKSWDELAGADAKLAYEARWLLSAASKQTLALLGKHLQPAKMDIKQITAWAGNLGSSSFKEREIAMAELEKAGDTAEGALQKALEQKPSLEAKLRIELLLGKLNPVPTGKLLRTLRAIAILETIGGEEARAILRPLANGAPGARVTEAAKEALKRM